MDKTEMAYIIAKICKKLNELLKIIKVNSFEENIHEFRVEVKKLRSFLRLLNSQKGKENFIKLPKKIKRIYTLAGKIRDIQLHLQKLKTVRCKKEQYVCLLHKRLNKYIIRLKKILQKKPLKSVHKKIIKNLPDFLEPQKVTHYFQQEVSKINSLLSDPHRSDRELHVIRKNIKDLLYICKIFQGDATKPMPVELWGETELKNAEHLASELGSLNDASTALTFMGPAYLDKINRRERRDLQKLSESWIIDKTMVKKNLPTLHPFTKNLATEAG